MEAIFANAWNLTWQQVVMWCIGGILLYLAIRKDMEPSLLLIGVGAAYSYIALVPAVQPRIIRMLTAKQGRRIRMAYPHAVARNAGAYAVSAFCACVKQMRSMRMLTY